MRLALAQLNAVVGDLDGNRDAHPRRDPRGAVDAGADLVVFPELAVTGYPPEDLLLRPGFVKAARASLDEIAARLHRDHRARRLPALRPRPRERLRRLLRRRGAGVYRKHFLPNYGVFDEHRYFAAGRELLLLRCGDVLVGPTICEDVWQPGPPATDLALAGAQLLVNLSASPFHVGKAEDREEMLVTRARDNASYLAFCNLVGGQDELVFDGHSVVLDDEGEVVARAPGFEEALLVVDVDPTEAIGRRLRDVRRRELERSREDAPPAHRRRAAGAPRQRPGRAAVAVAVRVRARADAARARPRPPRLRRRRTASGDVVLGISRRDRLRAHRCDLRRRARGRARARRLDAVALLLCGHPRRRARGEREPRRRLPRDPDRGVVGAFHEALGGARGLAAENLQARIRGTILMALSNAHGWLVVATGNKSEMAVGYATLYGDMVGGFALLKDVFKTDVFRLARHLNERAGRELIPVTTIERPPTAELRADQRDDQSLPPYDLLDPVLEAYVELDRSREELLAEFDAADGRAGRSRSSTAPSTSAARRRPA